MIERVFESSYFKGIVGLATVIAFFFIWLQIHRNSSDAKASRTIDLMGRYYSEYHDLKVSLEHKYKDNSKIPIPIVKNQEDLDQIVKNYEKQLDFLYELALYWKKGLLDKEIIKDRLTSKIVFETYIMQNLYIDDKYMLKLGALKEMSEELVAKSFIDYRLIKFWKKLGIKNYYYFPPYSK